MKLPNKITIIFQKKDKKNLPNLTAKQTSTSQRICYEKNRKRLNLFPPINKGHRDDAGNAHAKCCNPISNAVQFNCSLSKEVAEEQSRNDSEQYN